MDYRFKTLMMFQALFCARDQQLFLKRSDSKHFRL